MREARAEKDDSHDEQRNQRQSRRRCGTRRARRAEEGPLEEGCQQEEGAPTAKKAAKGAKAKADAPKKEAKAARAPKNATEARSNKNVWSAAFRQGESSRGLGNSLQ